MGRDTYRYQALDAERAKRGQLDPIWRGIGCVLIVGMAFVGFLVATWFLSANLRNNWLYLPPVLYNPSIFPPIDRYLGNGVMLKLIVAFLFMIFGFGIIATVYAMAFPIQPREFDAPPPRKVKIRKR